VTLRPARRIRGLLLGALCLAAPSLSLGGAPQPQFDEVTTEVGIDTDQLLLYPGPAWGDYDRDGCADLYLPGPEESFLYRNACDGSFEHSPVSDSVSPPNRGSRGAAFADFDNDGWLDLYVTSPQENMLFHNDSGQGFTDVSSAAGVDDGRPSYSVGWADYDADGDLDLFVGNYHFGEDPPESRDTIYRNDGDGTFTDVSSSFQPVSRLRRPNLAVRWFDYDNDADVDLYVVNDRFAGNVLWRNDGAGCGEWCWTDVAEATGADRPIDGMGVDAGDFDADGDLDLYFSGINEAVLLRSEIAQGQDLFTDISEQAGVSPPGISWAALFFDYDNDAWQDLLLAVTDGLGNRIYKNSRDGSFEDISEGSGIENLTGSKGIALSDFDGDGKLDAVVGDSDSTYRLFRNVTTTDYGWLSVTVEGSGPVARDAIGTKIFVTTSDGRVQYQDVKSGNGFCSGNDMANHFGLGEETVESLTLLWPDGSSETFGSVPQNQRRHFVYGQVVFADGFESGGTTAWSATVP